MGSNEPAEAEQTAAQRQSEYEHAKNFCDNMQPPETGNFCKDVSAQIEHAEQCVALYEAWDNKWQPGRHGTKLDDWGTRINIKKGLHKHICAPHKQGF